MEWGLDRKLKEHTEMIDSMIESRITKTENRLAKLDTDFNVYKLDCIEHRRRFDDWIKSMTLSQQKQEVSQENTEKNVQCIKTILETHLPNLKDLQEKAATKHQLKEGALWVSAVLGALLTIGTVILAITAYFNGYFIK